jgi:DNA-binding transcriptional MerR regulator
MTARTAKETAERLGISVKALRVYEARGLVSPRRTAAGWRIYGDDDLRTLHKVLTLKALGFGLAEIETLLHEGVDLAQMLAAQAAGIEERLARLIFAKQVLASARARLAAGVDLSVDELVTLTQETTMNTTPWTDAHETLARRHFDAAQMDTLAARKLSPELQATLFTEWQALIEEAERLREGPADSPQALALARRWSALARRFSGGDAELERALATWYEEGFADAATARLMPFSREVWDFVRAAVAHVPDGRV